jgi:hypothetical protein
MLALEANKSGHGRTLGGVVPAAMMRIIANNNVRTGIATGWIVIFPAVSGSEFLLTAEKKPMFP